MEDVLDVYQRPVDPKRPLVCLDEKPVQLLADIKPPLGPRPGRPARQDYEYKREGTGNLFVAFEPLTNWRKFEVTRQRTRQDFAAFLTDLVEKRYRDAEKIVLVMDNLNTHSPASLYELLPADQAKRIADRLEIHYTPKHGSWLNMAEIEFSVVGKRLPARLADLDGLARHTAAIEKERNRKSAGADWRFTTDKARIKLKRLYPSIELR
jgi:transposase